MLIKVCILVIVIGILTPSLIKIYKDGKNQKDENI